MNWDELKFKAEDYACCCAVEKFNFDHKGCLIVRQCEADIANKILREKLDRAPLVSGTASEQGIGFEWSLGIDAKKVKTGEVNAVARLVDIRPVEPSEGD